MKLIIDIPQGLKIDFENENWTALTCMEMKNALMKGTPLPKGHGRLIDADALKKIIQENDVLNMTGFNVRLCDINNTPTIIEADKESEGV